MMFVVRPIAQIMNVELERTVFCARFIMLSSRGVRQISGNSVMMSMRIASM